MRASEITSNYKCILFLKDRHDKSLLQAGTSLYGEFIKLSKTFFISPYAPPSDTVSPIGKVEKHPYYYQKPGFLIVSYKGRSFTANTIIKNQKLQLTIEIIYKSAIYARTPFLASEMRLLWNKTVTIIGLGAGGSRIAVELAEAGVGHFKLCDPQKLDFANISRHEGDLFDVGKYKTQVAAERIYKVNPAVRIEIFNEDIFERPLSQVKQILKSNLVVAATDRRDIQLLINNLVYKFKIPAVFGGCYEEARRRSFVHLTKRTYALPGMPPCPIGTAGSKP